MKKLLRTPLKTAVNYTTGILLKAVMTYKILNNLCPGSLHGKFTTRSQISAYETRNFYDISIPKHNLEFSKRSFHYSAAKLWNEIPLQIRNGSKISRLKAN